jgi:branched-chain amino acid aminotransferase
MSFGQGKIWIDGKFVDWQDAKIHVLSHALHYGSTVFEGARCYKTKNGSAVFRLEAHIDRLYDSAKIYRMEIPFTREQFRQAVVETIKINKYEECYIRPFVFRGYGAMGVNPLKNPLQCAIAVWDWGTYLGEGVLEKGISVQVSSWNRFAPNTMPALAKAGGNYLNSQLIKMEATMNGFDEGIALDTYGYVSEGSGENIFMVKNDVIYTPSTSASILAGITRHSVFVLARDLGLRIEKHMIPRESLYIADELFFSGTAAEITPVTKVDNISVGKGNRGPITKKIQDEFFGIIRGEKKDRHNWLTFVY